MNTIAPPIALTKAIYQGLQRSKMALSLAHKTSIRRILSILRPSDRPIPVVEDEVVEVLQQRIEGLVERDWLDGERGIYPIELLFDEPWLENLLIYPWLCLDSISIWNRSLDGRYQDFDPSINVDQYPKYYARNFHHQTDGYLSDTSAKLYDLQVEILFSGVADAMRRRVIQPLRAGLSTLDSGESGESGESSASFQISNNGRSPRILDIACGTGRTLRNLRVALPNAALFGIDLSPNYLRRANEILRTLPETLPQLIQGNVESLPYADGYFQGITNIFLFHELPGPIRQRILNESYRVLAPGGTCIICDSLQAEDIPVLTPVLINFSQSFHEPFYGDYIKDDIDQRCREAGFEIVEHQTHFLSKYWVLRKPA